MVFCSFIPDTDVLEYAIDIAQVYIECFLDKRGDGFNIDPAIVQATIGI